MLQSLGPLRVRHNWATELNWTELYAVVVQSLSHVWVFSTPWTTACQVSLSFTSPSLLRFISIESVMLSDHSSSAALFSCLQTFPITSSFPVSQLFTSGGESIGTSAGQNNENHVAPAQEQLIRPVGQEWKSKTQPHHTSGFITKVPRPLTLERIVVLRQLKIHLQESELGPLSHTRYKSQFRVNQ